jgi:hypothetical protein
MLSGSLPALGEAGGLPCLDYATSVVDGRHSLNGIDPSNHANRTASSATWLFTRAGDPAAGDLAAGDPGAAIRPHPGTAAPNAASLPLRAQRPSHITTIDAINALRRQRDNLAAGDPQAGESAKLQHDAVRCPEPCAISHKAYSKRTID